MSATVPLLNTACVCDRKELPFAGYSVVKEPAFALRAPADKLWSEKTTVCRIFSCKRAELSWSGQERRALNRPLPILPIRDAAHQAGPFPPRLPSAASARRALRARPVNRQPNPTGLVEPSRNSRQRQRRERRLVENTGLEPVTSWLQTRRSPS